MNRLSPFKRMLMLNLMVERSSLRAISRTVPCSINIVAQLQWDAGAMARITHDYHVRGVNVHRLECDELWAFVYAKQANVAGATAAPPEAGTVWTWTAIDPVTKLFVAYLVTNGRNTPAATMFMHDLSDRVSKPVQITTDRLGSYLQAVETAFGSAVDYARTGRPPEVIAGNPNAAFIGTSYVERANLTIRSGVSRYTRSVTSFSKRISNHVNSLALFVFYYNFIRPHKGLNGQTPAMVAGITDGPWDWEWLLQLVDAPDAESAFEILKRTGSN